MVPLGSNDKTRVIGQDELEQIREGSGKVSYDEEEEAGEEEEPDEDELTEDGEKENGILNPKMEKQLLLWELSLQLSS